MATTLCIVNLLFAFGVKLLLSVLAAAIGVLDTKPVVTLMWHTSGDELLRKLMRIAAQVWSPPPHGSLPTGGVECVLT